MYVRLGLFLYVVFLAVFRFLASNIGRKVLHFYAIVQFILFEGRDFSIFHSVFVSFYEQVL